MRRIIILLGLVIICTIICVYKYAPQDYEDRGKWVKLKEDVPVDGYILHNNAVYQLFYLHLILLYTYAKVIILEQ